MERPADNLLLVFDLDGTLVDSREDLATAVNLMRQDFGLPPLPVATVAGCIGDGVRTLVARVLQDYPADLDEAVRRMTAHYLEHLHDRTVLYPGVREGLAALHRAGARLALISNKVEQACAALLRHFGILDLFSLVLGGDSVSRLKPDPEALVLAMRRLDAKPDRTWMIGDNHTDLEAARNAGIRSAFVTYGIGRPGALAPTRAFPAFEALTRFFLGEATATPEAAVACRIGAGRPDS